MSDLKVNIRVFYWHFQVKKNWKITISYNPAHVGKLNENGWFKVYEFNLIKNEE